MATGTPGPAEQRLSRATKKKHNIIKSPAEKVEDTIGTAADKVEKVAEAMAKKGKSFTVPQLRNFAKEAEDLVVGVIAGIENESDKKTFISAMKAAIAKAEKTKIAEKKK